MTAAEAAARLRARQVRPNEWRARCPHHRGKSETSLSVREASDGTVLLHCFGGCRSVDVLSAVGLSWRDIAARPKAPHPEDSLDRQTRSAIAQARDGFRRHPAASRLQEPLSVLVTDEANADLAIARGLALAAEGELAQIALEGETDQCRK